MIAGAAPLRRGRLGPRRADLLGLLRCHPLLRLQHRLRNPTIADRQGLVAGGQQPPRLLRVGGQRGSAVQTAGCGVPVDLHDPGRVQDLLADLVLLAAVDQLDLHRLRTAAPSTFGGTRRRSSR